ncbi:MAG TPA: class I SAM-dependent methyltransferase [Flavobacterium sp.]|nr:class I SAM-dependent methyltransferase [Flavobacterium sp.]
MDKSQAAAAVFDKCANLYQDKFMDVGLYHRSFDLFCDSIAKENADVLELACGPGNITKYLSKKRPDLKILGTDLAPNMIALAKKNNPTATFQLLDCREIGSIDKKYDAIMCGFCLPYLSKEEAVKLIRDAAQILNPGSVIYISTMEDDYSKSGYKKGSTGDEIFMNFHQADYLSTALGENHFNIIDLQRQNYPEKDGTNTIDLIIIARREIIL